MPERWQIVTNTQTQQIPHASVTLLIWTRHFKQNKYSTGCTWGRGGEGNSPRHNGMVSPPVMDGEDNFQANREAVNLLNNL